MPRRRRAAAGGSPRACSPRASSPSCARRRCSSSRTRARRATSPAWEGGYGYEGHAFGIGSAFLLAGVAQLRRHVLGGARRGERALRHHVLPRAGDGREPRRSAAPGAARDHRAARLAGAHLGELPALRRPGLHAAAAGRCGARDRRAAGPDAEPGVSLRRPGVGAHARGRSHGGRRPRAARGAGGRARATSSSGSSRRSIARAGARAAWSSSAARPGSARRRWSTRSSSACAAARRRARSRADSRSSSTAPAKPTCPCSRRGRASRATPAAPSWSTSSAGTRRHGSRSFPRCSTRPSTAPSSSRAQGATRERMLREMAELLEAVTAERPMILVLEDLHWSDHSTLELIAYVAQRRAPARLLLIGTYRPAEAKRRRFARCGRSPRSCRRAAAARRSSWRRSPPPTSATYLRGRLAGGEVDGRPGAPDPRPHRGPSALPRQRGRLRAPARAARRRVGPLGAARRTPTRSSRPCPTACAR